MPEFVRCTPRLRDKQKRSVPMLGVSLRHDFQPTDSRGDDFWDTGSGQKKAPLCGAFMGRAGLEPAFFGL